MSVPRQRPNRRRWSAALGAAIVGALLVTIPAAAFSSQWTKPKRVFPYAGQPLHSSVLDGDGKVHIATEKGRQGIHYVTNASGSWQTCQVSTGDDRFPSITLNGDGVHIAFARTDEGERALFTAHGPVPGCAFALVERYSGGTGSSEIAAWGDTLHLAFRTSTKKLKYTKGTAADPSWGVMETIDGYCCTSKPAVYFTTGGGVRIAYGDGNKTAKGLKFAVRTSGEWKKSQASSGRIKHVDLVLDHSPGVLTPPSNSPIMAFVRKGQGTFLTSKPKPNAKGSWATRKLGSQKGATGLTHWSNQTRVLLSGKGDLAHVVGSGGIWFTFAISNSGKEGKPVFHGSHLTFSRKGLGVYHSKLK